MKILIISDSHGDTTHLFEIFARHKVDKTIHLGDLEISKDFFSMTIVRGNSYLDPEAPLERILDIDGKKLFMTHGHVYSVHNGLTNISLKAQSVDADYCLFGHTHIPCFKENRGILYINPGSISRPRNGKSSYMILDTKNDSCILYNLLGEEIKTYERSN